MQKVIDYLGYAWDFLVNVMFANPLGTTESIARFLVLLIILCLGLLFFYGLMGGFWKPLKVKKQWNMKEGEYAVVIDPEMEGYRSPDEVRRYKL